MKGFAQHSVPASGLFTNNNDSAPTNDNLYQPKTHLMPLPYSQPTDSSAGSDDRNHLLVLWFPQLKHMYTMSPTPVTVEISSGSRQEDKVPATPSPRFQHNYYTRASVHDSNHSGIYMQSVELCAWVLHGFITHKTNVSLQGVQSWGAT